MDFSNVQVKVENVEGESIEGPPPAILYVPKMENHAIINFVDVASIKTEPASPDGDIETNTGPCERVEIVYEPCEEGEMDIKYNDVIGEQGGMKREPELDLNDKSGADKLEGAGLTSPSREDNQMTENVSDVQCGLEEDVESEWTVECQNADTRRRPIHHHDGLTNRCHVCHKLFHSKTNLLRHQRIHTGEKPFSCHICQNSFSQKSHLSQHIKTIHIGMRPFSCQTCQKSFTVKSSLSKHMLTHTAKKPLSCQRCQKSFSRKSGLSKHMLSHTAKKPLSCQRCQKSFSMKSNLTRHMLIHTGEKPFSCHTCQMSFSQKAHLSQHIKTIHIGMRPFSCQTCQKSFSEKSSLSRHMLIHTGEKPFSCQTCQRSFTEKSSLSRHMLIHT